MITTSNWGSTNFRTESTLRLFLTFVQVYLYSSIYGSSVLNLNVKDILTNVRACIFYNCTERLKSVGANITRKKLIKNLLIFYQASLNHMQTAPTTSNSHQKNFHSQSMKLRSPLIQLWQRNTKHLIQWYLHIMMALSDHTMQLSNLIIIC